MSVFILTLFADANRIFSALLSLTATPNCFAFSSVKAISVLIHVSPREYETARQSAERYPFIGPSYTQYAQPDSSKLTSYASYSYATSKISADVVGRRRIFIFGTVTLA